MSFIDSHAHLVLEPFQNDRDKVINEAFSSEITHIIQSCDNLDEIKQNLVLTEKYNNLYSSVGIHPHEASLWDDVSKITILEHSKKEKVIAIGETGLDFFYNYSPKEIQLKVFREQIKISKECSLPLIIHCRDAFNEALQILKEEKTEIPGVFHCFTGSLDNAKEALKLGFYISWSGILTFKNAKDLKEVAQEIPLEKTLIETDSPFLTPIPFRGKRNEPKFVKYVAEELAKIKNLNVEEVGQITSENTKKVFNIN
ncbi:MAG: TatD family hydrolase [Candidatus Melainabacteria bacterium]|nr:TatD family hydrolase [Candidatus Melainabacteria bacterium]